MSSKRELAVMDEVLDRINGLPPMYMEELDGPTPGPSGWGIDWMDDRPDAESRVGDSDD